MYERLRRFCFNVFALPLKPESCQDWKVGGDDCDLRRSESLRTYTYVYSFHFSHTSHHLVRAKKTKTNAAAAFAPLWRFNFADTFNNCSSKSSSPVGRSNHALKGWMCVFTFITIESVCGITHVRVFGPHTKRLNIKTKMKQFQLDTRRIKCSWVTQI